MREAFKLFTPFADVPKVTIFGSARTLPEDPLYVQTRELARDLADQGWMVVTGAGPGIMAAGAEGAGPERSIGVNIRLPFESPNALIADPNMVSMKYFFTRKLMLMKESAGFAVLPGGFGTLDEAFELLTLLQTGKAAPAPIVLLEVPGGTYWRAWERFIREEVLARGLISDDDLALYRITDDAAAARDEILGFFRNYHSIRFVGQRLVIRLRAAPTRRGVAGHQPGLRRHRHQGRHRGVGAVAGGGGRRRPRRPAPARPALRPGPPGSAAQPDRRPQPAAVGAAPGPARPRRGRGRRPPPSTPSPTEPGARVKSFAAPNRSAGDLSAPRNGWLLDVGVGRGQLEGVLALDGGDVGEAADGSPSPGRHRADDDADGPERLLDVHPLRLQPPDHVVEPAQAGVGDGDGDPLPAGRTRSRHYWGAWARPAPTSEAGRLRRRAVRTSVDHRVDPVPPPAVAHRAAMPATWGVAMLVPEWVA